MALRPTHLLIALAAALAAGLGGLAFSQTEAPAAPAPPAQPSGPEFDDFELILQRNIFDPNRVAPIVRDPNAPPRATPVPVQRIDLVGTWVLSAEKVAFINGDPADNDGEAKAGEEIVGFTVASISTDGVELAKNETKLTWPVGSHLSKRGEEDWTIEAGVNAGAGNNFRQRNNNNDNNGAGNRRNRNGGDADAAGGGRTGRNRGNNAATPARTPVAPPSDDAVRIMMERRQREMQGGAAAEPAAPAPAARIRGDQLEIPAEGMAIRATRISPETGQPVTAVTIVRPGEEAPAVEAEEIEIETEAPDEPQADAEEARPMNRE